MQYNTPLSSNTERWNSKTITTPNTQEFKRWAT